MQNLAISGCFLAIVIFAVLDRVDGRRNKVYKNCRYDKEKKWNEPGNYLNCTEEAKNVLENKLDCCDKNNGDLYCCDPTDKFDGDPNLIWAGIGVLGSLLLIYTFIYNWCDVQTFPWLKKYEKQINQQKKFWNSVANCTCCQVDRDGDRAYDSAIRQVGVIYQDEHQVAQFGKGDSVHLKFYDFDGGYEC